MVLEKDAKQLIKMTEELHSHLYCMGNLVETSDDIYSDITEWTKRVKEDLKTAWKILGYIEYYKKSNSE